MAPYHPENKQKGWKILIRNKKGLKKGRSLKALESDLRQLFPEDKTLEEAQVFYSLEDLEDRGMREQIDDILNQIKIDYTKY